jgi:hypothetical protein
MKKWLLISLTVVGLLALGIGCVPTATPAATTPQVSPLTDLQNWRQGMDTWKTTVADPAIAKANALGSQPNYDSAIASIKATESDKDQKIADLTSRITSLENWKATQGTVAVQQPVQNGQQGQTTQFQQGTTPGAITTSPSGVVTSQVNVVSGNLQIASAPGLSTQPVWYVQRLTNYNSNIQYVRPIINIAQTSNYGYNVLATPVKSVTVGINSNQCTVTATGTWTSPNPVVSIIGTSNPTQSTDAYQLSVSPGLGYATNSISISPVKGCGTPSGEIYLMPAQYVDITVQISNFQTVTSAFWTVTPSLSYHP